MTATIQKWGNSNGIRIPKLFLEELGIEENEEVEIIKNYDSIIIRKKKLKKKYKSLEDLFKDYDGDYVCEEYDWGKPVGKEVW